MAGKLRRLTKLAYAQALRPFPDDFAACVDFFRAFGHFPNLADPHGFSEKLQHLKLRDRDPRLPDLVDKVRVKDHVVAALGEDWVIPTLWHGERVTEDVLAAIPKPAVMKSNHASAQTLFLRNDTNLRHAARTANAWLKYDHHLVHREWAYGKVRREILIEPFVGGEQSPDDYKFWVFDGAVRFVQVDRDRFRAHTREFYTPDWKRLDFLITYPAPIAEAPPPPHLAEMLNAAEILAKGFRFVRVDLYDTAERPLFGELTFLPDGGLCRFKPARLDREIGDSWLYPGAPGAASEQ